ncbi:PREDICTED: interferon-induced very large GTPase 1-like [Nanorana parkeri]|uniref:interferon-induced very large GTPase 1-like n=1 Tax=Nanorana parkeri TaxID=125878 RepID=UPI000854F220|nr:PREDICTED: interferon-induced very large GTPase 1-like [Nanorana parkeri]
MDLKEDLLVWYNFLDAFNDAAVPGTSTGRRSGGFPMPRASMEFDVSLISGTIRNSVAPKTWAEYSSAWQKWSFFNVDMEDCCKSFIIPRQLSGKSVELNGILPNPEAVLAETQKCTCSRGRKSRFIENLLKKGKEYNYVTSNRISLLPQGRGPGQSFNIPLENKEPEEHLDDMCESTSPSPVYKEDKKENVNSLCDLQSPSLVTPQGDTGMEENVDILGGLEPSAAIPPLKNKETEDHLEDIREMTSPGLVYPQDKKENVSSLCDLEPPSLMATKEPNKTEDKLDGVCELASPSHVSRCIPDDQPSSRYTSVEVDDLHTRETTFHQLVERMNMKPYLASKLTLRDILSIGLENVHGQPPKTVEDLPWNYLRKLMALNRTMRDILEKDKDVNDNYDNDDDDDNLFNASLVSGDNSSASIHPLDVLCVLLHCSDSFLQQEIVSKLSMCQFAVPLLFPASDGSHCTLMLGAMRDIVKKWRPQSLADIKGFREENVVNTSMPIFSFVRLGKNKLSKSKILNQVLNPAQLHNNFFIHDNMEGGNIKRQISDGLVEMSWYFPCGKSDVFPEPIAVTNLRGDVETNGDQFMFLTQISSAVFIFLESISEGEFRLLSTCHTTDTQYYFIVTPGPGKAVSAQTQKTLQNLKPALKLKKSNVIMHDGTANEAAFVKKLQSIFVNFLNSKSKKNSLRDLEKETCELHIQVDESVAECQKARDHAKQITEEITNVSEYKKNTLTLQGDLWRKLSKLEKELCRMTNQKGKETQQYKDELEKEQISLHEEQHKHDLPPGLKLFIEAIADFFQTEKQYFIKWMKLELDSIARDHLSTLQAQYKEKCNNISSNKKELKQIDQKIADSSLGIEHFLREMGQFYEAECSMVKVNKITKRFRQFVRLPEIAANLLLDGFPLELIDGDVSNIPLGWITDVLKELDRKTGGKCRMRVITVLGVQSTGKSTLLNTMFGLQFPVASGRCTRGAFMTLLNVKENLHEELGCHFILVIDTEGLKAPELASLESSYEHDNELATLVVGLSDITIINMAMENTTEMKDILQIVVHAFLRMKEIGKRPNCQFVHQNVSDVSAHEKNMRDRKKLLEQLNETTKVAAAMENKSEIKTFSDVMNYNLEKDNWYIPGLWLGVPPMAPVNSGYSEHVSELKKYLLELMKTKKSQNKPSTVPEFIEWIKSLWNAVKHEKFLFSFRNSLVADAYNKLCIQYSQWEWEFQKAVHEWQIHTETNIKNQTTESLNDELCSEFKDELNRLLLKEKTEMVKLLENYFNNENENVHLIIRYKEEFTLGIESLRKELEINALSRIDEAVSVQKGKFKIEKIKSGSQKLIEDKITDLLGKCREKNEKLSQRELQDTFEEMWEKTLTEQQIEKLPRRIVSKPMLTQLRNDMSTKGPDINEALLRVHNLEENIKYFFKIDEKHIQTGTLEKVKKWFRYENKEVYDKIENFAVSVINKCDTFVREKVKTEQDYDDTYCREILHMINTELSKEPKNLNFSSHFELDIKCHILGRASQEFQAMHDKFIETNDPKLSLERLKPGYLQIFTCTFEEKDIRQTKAKEFCERCLKPAMKDHVFKHLGNKIVDDILHGSDNKKFRSRTFFQSFLMKDLLEEESFQKYVTFIGSYEEYTRDWIQNYIEEKYGDPQFLKPLEENIISSVTTKVKAALKGDKCLRSSYISYFLKCVCELLQNELVIPQDEMKLITFQNTADVVQFSDNILLFLKDTESGILSELQSMNIKSVLSMVTMKPQDELFRKVVGCGKQCPFCKVPCEAGGGEHKEHFATIHRPDGLGRYRWSLSEELTTDICSSSVISDNRFKNTDTDVSWHPYKNYREIYPDWSIQPDASIESSDYWKYIFVMYNEKFAEEYKAKPAKLPDGWRKITKKDVLGSLARVFNENP